MLGRHFPVLVLSLSPGMYKDLRRFHCKTSVRKNPKTGTKNQMCVRTHESKYDLLELSDQCGIESRR